MGRKGLTDAAVKTHYQMSEKAAIRDLGVLKTSSNEAATSTNASCGLVSRAQPG
jgi:hypothetical protein